MTTISIIVPTVLGNERLLKRALTSLVQHKSPDVDYEIIVVANDWEGFSVPVNKGLKKALGEYLLIMNDDVVILESGWEKTMLDAMTDNVGIVGPFESIQHGKYSALWFTLIKRKVFEEVGYLDEQMNLYSQDIDLGYKALKAGFATAFLRVPVKHFTSSTTNKISFEENEKYKNQAKEVFKQKWGIDHDSC